MPWGSKTKHMTKQQDKARLIRLGLAAFSGALARSANTWKRKALPARTGARIGLILSGGGARAAYQVGVLAPISPALQLGADRIFIIGVGQVTGPLASAGNVPSHPSLAQIGDHILDAIFADTLEMDLERLRRINETVALIPPSLRTRNGMKWRPVDALVVTPSKSFAHATARHARELPPAIRMLLRALGAMREDRTNVLSYLLTEGRYCSSLMRQGFRDAIARRIDICRFLDLDVAVPARRRSTTRLARPATGGALAVGNPALPEGSSP
ncbi:MAG: hypothetical protein WA807_08510 [Steroidobacteraceae bacterium]